MLSRAMTERKIVDNLVVRATVGVHRVKSRTVAAAIGIAPSTVQHYGRKGLTHHRWAIVYDRGWFHISQREDWAPRPGPTVPDWFEPPPDIQRTAKVRTCCFDVGQRRAYVYSFIEDCLAGHIALAPWQRGEVWTERQQIDLLDSMIRGLSIGALTMWHAGAEHAVIGRPLAGCDINRENSWRNHLIVDGQQRATTLIRAARGHLDHWRWNGREWSTGKGFLTPQLAVTYATSDIAGHRNWAGLAFDAGSVNKMMFGDYEKIQRTELDLMVLGGSTAQMIETYRRLATHGSPHSPEDLALMERWASENISTDKDAGT